ncbi:MAG: TolC family protein, partial [Myxococcota bacterium]
FQLRQAWARLEQTDALQRAAAAGLFPQINAEASVGRSKSPPRVFNLGGQEQEIPGVEADQYGASLPVSYELDVWGRVRSGMLAAEQDRVAARADVEAVAMTISANVAERWFDVLQQRSLRALVESQNDVNRTSLELAELRFSQGDAPLSEVLQQRQQMQQLDTQLAQVRAAEDVAEQQLAALVGKSPKKLVPADRTALPSLPPLPPEGISARLVEGRPDVRAAKARVVAADYRIAQAIANRLPQLTLSGSVGFNSVTIGSFFESFIWSITGAIAGTVWDGGRLDSEIDRSKAVLKERVAAYGEALITALVEVEGALTQERAGVSQLTTLDQQVDTARQTFELARRRYAAGIGDYLTVLTALRSLQQAEQTRLTTQRQILSQRIQVYRALGSSWTEELEPPDEDDEDTPEGQPS